MFFVREPLKNIGSQTLLESEDFKNHVNLETTMPAIISARQLHLFVMFLILYTHVRTVTPDSFPLKYKEHVVDQGKSGNFPNR